MVAEDTAMRVLARDWRLPAADASLLVVPLAALGYLGIGWLAALPLASAGLCLLLRTWRLQDRWPLVTLLVGLFLFLASAVLSAAMHRSAISPYFMQSLGASTAVGLVLALARRRLGMALMMVGAFLTMAAMFTVLVVSDLGALEHKSVLVTQLLGLVRQTRAPSAGQYVLHPNTVGLVASVSGAGWLGLTVAVKQPFKRCVVAGALIVTLVVLALTGSNAGYLAFLSGSLALLALHMRRPVIVLLPLVGGAITVVLFLLAGQDGAAVLGRSSLFSRQGTWSGTMAAISTSPLTGRGIGSFPVAYQPSGFADPVAIGPHNTFLQVWLDLGLPGLIAVVALTIATLWWSFRQASRSPSALALSGVAVAWVVHSMFESTVLVAWRTSWPWTGWHEAVVPLGFAIWGLGASLDRPRSRVQVVAEPRAA
jgi:O-antigen ligase